MVLRICMFVAGRLGRDARAADPDEPVPIGLARRACAGLLVAASTLLAGCGGGGGATVSPGDTQSFHVVEIEPREGKQDVALDAAVRITFSQPIDPDSVRNDSIVVGAAEKGTVGGRTAVAADGEGLVLVWTPTEPLFARCSHLCVLHDALRSVAGQQVDGLTTFAFGTVGSVPTDPLPHPGALRSTPGRLNIGRRSHTATLLADGRVLVAGGFKEGSLTTNSAEVYEDGRFELAAERMALARAGHVAVLLQDGRVLFAGGWYEAQLAQLQTTDHAEIYDPVTGLFESVGPMTTQRVDHRALLLPSGRVLVTGGTRLDGSVFTDLSSAELFDPLQNTFSPLATEMSASRATHVMEYLGADRIVLYGGTDVDLRPEVFTFADEEFHTLGVPAQDGMRFGVMGARFGDGSVMVAGGDDLGTVMHVDPVAEHVVNSGSGLSFPRAYGTATRVASDRVLVVGGFDMSRGFYLLSTADLVVRGGIAGSETFSAELRFPTGMALHTATLLSNGSVLFCGGLNEEGGLPELGAAYLYEPWK